MKGGISSLVALALPIIPTNLPEQFIANHRIAICDMAAQYSVPAGLLAGVIDAENSLNKNFVDDAQSAALQLALKDRSPETWDLWREENERLAKQALKQRAISNKWPVDLWVSGYVQSFGPAQITPRTALRACQIAGAGAPSCASTAATLRALLQPEKSIEIAAVVLRSEQIVLLRDFNKDLRNSIGLWATVYNVGSDYFEVSYQRRYGSVPNKMGRWVVDRQVRIASLLGCPAD